MSLQHCKQHIHKEDILVQDAGIFEDVVSQRRPTSNAINTALDLGTDGATLLFPKTSWDPEAPYGS